MSEVVKRIVDEFALLYKEGTVWKPATVVEAPTYPPESVAEEDVTVFGDDYVDRLPSLRDRDLFTVKVLDTGDIDGLIAMTTGCVREWRLKYTLSNKECDDPDIVTRDLHFKAYIQSRSADTVTVSGARVPAISLSLRLKSDVKPHTSP